MYDKNSYKTTGKESAPEMKKILSILTALCLACLLVSACAEESVCGTWALKSPCAKTAR